MYFVANFVLFQVHYSLVSIISHIGKKAYGGTFFVFMTYHSHTSFGVNQLHNEANKCVSSLQAITSVKVFTMRPTKVT